jgi:hypothetical protein
MHIVISKKKSVTLSQQEIGSESIMISPFTGNECHVSDLLEIKLRCFSKMVHHRKILYMPEMFLPSTPRKNAHWFIGDHI